MLIDWKGSIIRKVIYKKCVEIEYIVDETGKEGWKRGYNSNETANERKTG